MNTKNEKAKLIQSIYALTPLQEGLLYYYLLDPTSTSYIMQSSYNMPIEMCEEKLKEALELLTLKYDALRTTIVYEKLKAPKQVVLKERSPEFESIDLREKDSKQQADEIRQLIDNDLKRGFDLQKDTLLRVKHIRRDKGSSKLLWTMHHIIVDGWCLSLIMNSFYQFYEALANGESYAVLREDLLGDTRNEYKSYVKWLEEQDTEAAYTYWDNLLIGYDSDADVKAMRACEETERKSLVENVSLGFELTEKVQEMAVSNDVTISTIMETIWGILLQQLNQTNDVVFGKVVSGRGANVDEIEEMVGLFINTIPLRVTITEQTTFSELIREIQNQNNESSVYDYCSLGEIQEKTPQKSELIKTIYVFQNYRMESYESEYSESDSSVIGNMDFAREETTYPLSFKSYIGEEGLSIELMYLSDEFTVEDVKDLLGKILRIIEVISNHPDHVVSLIPSVTAEEEFLILGKFNDTAVDYPREKTVVELFEEQVEKTPDHIALVFEDEEVTYREFNRRVNILAHKLRGLGVGPDDYVGIMTERSIEMLIGIYGIIKAGGAYVPLDPSYPKERIKYILNDSKPKVVLTYQSEIETNIPIINLGGSAVWEGVVDNPEIITQPNDLIYLIYTSGTTGNPKGVMIEHSGVINLLNWQQNHYSLTEKDTILLKTTYVFDVSVSEIFWWSAVGARLSILKPGLEKDPKKIAEIIKQHQVSIVNFVPSMLSMFTSYISALDEEVQKLRSLKYILAAGEALTLQNVKEFYSAIEGCKLSIKLGNIYGPTEASVYSTYYDCEAEMATIPIGRPISNTQVHMMNGEVLCGIGVPGELCISGDGLSRGYLNQPELTNEKFISNPYGEGKLYRTGDLARWLPDGNIEYMGRIDEQVKIRGFRIELGEIESKLREIEEVRDCAVIVREDALGEKAIYGYVISDEALSMSEIRESLLNVLPDYMVPSYLMQIESIPLTRNGKLDKCALPEIDVRLEREYVAPRNEIEEKLCTIFEEVLGIEEVGIKDGFFELGGHSLRATRLVNRIESELGSKVPLKDIFSHSTVEALAELMMRSELVDYTPIPTAGKKTHYEMSSAQKRIYLIQQMDLEAVTYNMPQYLKLTGAIDIEGLRQAFQNLINRHEILRTSFMMLEGELVQYVQEEVEVDFEYKTGVLENESDLMLAFIQPFDLSQASQLRVKLVKLPDHYLLMIDMHHIISDGMSMGTFINEFTALYNGKSLESLTHQFKDYSEWMRDRDLSDQQEYWINEFGDEIPVLDMPLDFARPKEQSFEGSMVGLETNKELGDKIRRLAIETGTTEYMIFLASAMILLGKYANQEDVIIGSPISGRTHQDTERMLGMFINTLAMRGLPEKEKSFEQLLAEVKESSLKAYENQEYPFEELIKAIDVTRDLSRHPLFDVMLVMQNNERGDYRLEGIQVELPDGEGLEHHISKFDLSFNIWEQEGSYGIALEYCSALFQEETVERMLEHYVELLNNLLESPTAKLEEVGMITENEECLILEGFNDAYVDYPKDKTVIELFEEQVKRTPNKVAVVFGDASITYEELNGRANVLAHKLRELGVGPDDYVGIISERSIEMIVGLCGILKSGGAYVPIDSDYPFERITYILDDSKPKVVLTYQSEVETSVPVIDLGKSEIWESVNENPERINRSNDLIYLIYTSGTTGNPKGVMIEHQSVVRLVKNQNYVELNEDTIILQTGSMSFDASTFEIWGTLLNGGKVVLLIEDALLNPVRLKEGIIRNRINTMFITTALYNQLIDIDPSLFDSLEQLLFGGEATSEEHVMKLVGRDLKLSFSNIYGPTENTTFSLYYPITNETLREKTPIGRPISNTQVYISNGEVLCGIGVPGELCISGDGLARGYLNLPELTAEKFVDNPYGEGKLYRTGDLARWSPDGNIEYMGRIDEQIKVRGFRVELGEIESKLRELKEVRDCAVIVREDSLGDKAINAYLVSDDELSMTQIRDSLGKILPEYMIPSYLMQIESIPITRNGKLDKRSLPEIDVRLEREYVSPRNELEENLCSIFEDILGIERVGIKDGFFELGGDSIKAIRIVSKMRELNYAIAVKEIMQGKTIENISLSVKEQLIDNPYEQGEVVGVVEKTPIIKSFDHWDLAKPHHFNQAMMFRVGDAGSAEVVKTLRELVIYHDMLRAVYRNNILEILPSEESKLFDFYEFDFVEELDARRAVELECTKIQGSINLSEGPLLKAALFQVKEGSFLMVCIHHLVVDGVSWRILGEDFERVLSQVMEQKEVKLPKKTASFKEWSNLLSEYGKGLKNKERRYWDQVQSKLERGKVRESEELNEDRGKESIISLHASFSKEVTERLEKEGNVAYGTKIDELLLSGLSHAMRQLTGQDALSIMLEGHGREELHKRVEVDRTIGWFTSIYPVVLECSEDIRKNIIETKEKLRGIPGGGLGYSYVLNEESIEPDVYFNYLGSFTNEGGGIQYSSGESSDQANGLTGAINFNGSISNGVLMFEVSCDGSRFGSRFVEELSHQFETSVLELVNHCLSREEEKTASDYGLIDISMLEFGELISTVGVEPDKIYALTPLQEGLLYHYFLDPTSTSYIMQSSYNMIGEMCEEKIKEALELLSLKYDALRTTIVYEKLKTPKQVVLKERSPEFESIDLREKDSKQQADEISHLIDTDLKRGFDLQKDTLLRVKYIRTSEGSSKLLWTMHHIVVDGWCLSLIMNSFYQFYEALNNGENYTTLREELLSDTRNEYKNHVKWLEEQDTEVAYAYWDNLLADYDSEADAKALRVCAESERKSLIERVSIGADLTEKVQEVAVANDVTVSTIMETIWGILLQQLNQTNDVVFGKVVSGRGADIAGIESMVGLFINTIPLRVITTEQTTFSELIREIQNQNTESSVYDYCSLSKIQERTTQKGELIKTIYVFQNYRMESYESEYSEGDSNIVGNMDFGREETTYPLSFKSYIGEEGLLLELMYLSDEFTVEDVRDLLSKILRIIEVISNHPDHVVSLIPSVTAEEERLILGEFNDTVVDYPREKTVIELFEEQVRRTPYHIAVAFGDVKITYEELNERANALAYKLRELEVGPDDYVGIMTERSIEMIVGIYGTIKAGGAYVPLDPSYPVERVKYILDDSKPKAILTYQCEVETEIPVIDLGISEVWKGETENPAIVNHPSDLIYLIYTSGTTGNPKGVMIEHKNVVRLFKNNKFQFDFNEDDVWSMFHSYAFDFSVWEMYGATLTGGKLLIIPRSVAQDPEMFLHYIEKYQISILNQVPSAFYGLMHVESKSSKMKSVRYLIFGGEALSPQKLDLWHNKYPNAKIVNMYGITETTVHVTYREITEVEIERGISDIGKAIPTLQTYIMNGDVLCGIGILGELCVSGDGLARGYLNLPELTAEKFINNPYGTGKLYRSGDLARWLPDGNIEYLGRIDDQVKIRGFRIELGEIENAVRELEEVRDCAVITREDALGEKAIYAYVISNNELSMSELREILAKTLPDYMVPSYLMQIESIPVTNNGKLNRRALPEIDVRLEREYVTPRNEIEESLCSIFEEILGVERVGIKDGFFELGGHSLRATRLVNRVESELGVKIPLKEIFSSSTVELLSELITEKENIDYISIPKADKKAYYEMSSAQKRIYLIQEMAPEAVTYNMPQYLKLTGELDVNQVKQSFQDLINRYEILRTEFRVLEGELVQFIHEEMAVDFEYQAEVSEAKADLMLDFVQPFDLSQASQLRVKLIKLSDHYLLMIDMHHIVSDGVSIGTFIDEFTDLYNGKPLESLTHQFKDYSEWMRSRDISDQKNYWINEFSDEIPVLDLPLDYVRPKEQSFEGSMVGLESSKELGDKLRKLAIETGTTEYMIFLASAMVLLGKYANQEDVVIGSPISGRTHQDTEALLGMFVNTLAMRGRPEKEKSFKQLLEEVKESNLKAHENQEYPFEELIEAIDVKRDLSRHPLFDVMLVMQNNETSEYGLKGIQVELPEGEGISHRISKFDLTFNIWEQEGSYGIALEYCTALFKKESMKRMLEHYVVLLNNLVERPTAKLNEVGMVTGKEEGLILVDFNDTAVDYPKEKTVNELLEEQVKKTPNKVAVIFDDAKITYEELNKRANVLAHRLRELGVGPDDYVGIMAERSIEMIVGIYGIIKSGGAYVPIDPDYPSERIQYILDDSKPKALVTYGMELELKLDVPVINLEELEFLGVGEKERANPELITQSSDLIYLIYTSGTTGNPKGVMIEHQSVVRLVKNQNYVELNEETIILQTGSMSFDASTFEMWGALLNGGQLILTDQETITNNEKLSIAFERYEVNTIWLTSTLFNQLIQTNEALFDELEYVLVGGEELSVNHISVLKGRESKVTIINGYGPTENTTFTATYEISDHSYSTIPIGRPISNTQVYILNGEALCGIGVPGELCISGDGLSRGYLNQPELTSEKFVDNPCGEGRLYRTGDLARWLPDGNIEYMGRIDEQVKIRGFRIELGEIKSRLREVKGIKDCAVIVREDLLGEKAIYGYVISDETLIMSEIREGLLDVLPDYMVPSYLMQIDVIPLTRNGKLDRRALPEIDVRLEREYVAPRTEMEESLCRIFEDILGVERVGIKDNFFELGGHSLRATRLVNRIESELGIKVPLKEIFSNSTVELSSELISEKESIDYLPISKAQEKVYYEMSSAQKRIYLIQEIAPEAVTYNMPQYLKLTGELDVERVRQAFQELINRHEILRTSFMMLEGELVQRIHEGIEIDFEYKVETLGDGADLMSDFIQPFDLSRPSQLRVKLIKLSDHYLLMIDMHHIVSDGMSIGTFINEFTALYNGKPLESLTHQFKDYSEWMKDRDLSDQQEYWINEFGDEIPVLDLPLDYVRPKEQSFEGSMVGLEVGKELGDKLRKLATETGTTEYMIFLASAMVLLGKYGNQEDVVIGSPISGRTHKDTEQMLGMFVNTLAMRGRPEGDKSFESLLKEVKESSLKAYEHQEYPFEELIEAIDVRRDLSRHPLFDVVLVMQNNEASEFKLEGASTELSVSEGLDHRISKFDLSFNVYEGEEGNYVIGLEYCSALFKEETVKRMLSHYVELIGRLVDSPRAKLNEVGMTTENEACLILGEFNATTVEYPREKTVVQLFEEQVERTPRKVAVVFGDVKITYEELNERANALAHRLREMGVGPDDYVGIIAERSIEMIVGLYGIIKAGGAYVPLDPSYPVERVKYILDDSNPKVILTYQSEIETNIPVIDLGEEGTFEGESSNPVHVNSPSDLIYVIYTSGTTGNPKGVMIEHQSVVNLVGWQKATGNYGEETTVIQNFNYVFDGSVWEIFPALLSGSSLEVLSEDQRTDVLKLVELLPGKQMMMTPSQFKLIVDHVEETELVERFPAFDKLYLGGEAVSLDVLERYGSLPGSKLDSIYNAYGPTESTVCASFYKYDLDNPYQTIPIGRPISNTQVYILNGEALCGIGIPGELCIAGDGLSRGYLNQPELTVKKFISNPYGAGKLYRTGDLARWLPDGNIEYMGRIDDQVKIRGFRIELREIENAVREIEEVKDCVVVTREDRSGEKAIYGYVISDHELGMSELRESLLSVLPDYMVPSYLMQIESIPLTRNGKLDRKALPEIDVRLEREFVAPRTGVEESLCRIFEDILGVDRVGIKDGFFELGGDSIKAIRVVSKLRELNYAIAVKDIMQGKTIENISLNVKEEVVENPYEQGEVVGVVEKTPIIKSFDRWNFAKPHHFNQAMMFRVGDAGSTEVVRTLRELVTYHDMLRAVYRNNTLEILSSEESKLFDFYAFDLREEVDVEGTIESKSTEIQGSINLSEGPLLKAALFQVKEGSFLMVCIHHLVVDGVSWRILGEDFERVLSQVMKQEEVNLPKKTASFKEWSSLLSEYGKGLSEKERTYWEQIQSTLEKGKVKDLSHADKASSEKEMVKAHVALSQKVTDQLQKKANVTYGTKVDELMLSALSLAINKLTDQKHVSVMLEGHGREEVHKSIQIDRTVGWFTSMYPVVLECSEDIRSHVIKTKELMRSIPNGGLGYGYTSTDLPIEPDIYFNYLGEFSDSGSEVSYSTGEAISEENGSIGAINFNGGISNGMLGFEISCEAKHFGVEFIQKLAEEFEGCISQVLEFCIQAEIEKTASDYGLRDISMSEFESLIAGYERREEIEKIYSLTPLQEEYLQYYLLDPTSTSYTVQISYSMTGEMCEEKLKEALGLLSLKYDALRTTIVYEKLKTPKQVVLKERKPEYEKIDLRAEELVEEKVDQIIADDLKRGFDLQKDTLLRVKHIRLSEGSKLLWTMHHIVVDGWCSSLIMNSFYHLYEALTNGESYTNLREDLISSTRNEYRSYVKWLEEQDTATAYAYWDDLLVGYDSEADVKALRECKKTERKSVAERVSIGAELTEKIQEIAVANDVTISTIMETIWGILLQQLNQANDVVFGKVVSGRGANVEEIEEMVGLFINTIPLRVTTTDQTTFSELIREIQKQNNESNEYDYCSLSEIQERATQKSELIKTIYKFQNYRMESYESEYSESDSVMGSMDFAHEEMPYSLTFQSYMGFESLLIELMYLSDEYSIEDVRDLLGKVLKIIEVISNDSDHVVSLIPSVRAEK